MVIFQITLLTNGVVNAGKTNLIIIAIAILIVMIISILTYKYHYSRRIVESTSKTLKMIQELNFSFKNSFLKLEYQRNIDRYYDTKSQFDKEEPNLVLYFVVKESLDKFEELLQKNKLNRENREKYSIEFSRIKANRYNLKPDSFQIKEKRYRKIEHDLIMDSKLKDINSSIFINVKMNYTTPAGRNSYKKEKGFHEFDLVEIVQEIKKGLSYQIDDEMHKYIQRGLMTPKLRLSILRRDDFKCYYCGRGAKDGVKLHVDHIIPVSKGGLTIESNLRTLCEDCNIGKSDEIIEDNSDLKN